MSEEEINSVFKSRCGLERYFLKNASIMLYGPLNDELTYNVVNELRYLSNKDNIEEISIYIHSEGGDVDGCCAIIDAIDRAKNKGYIIRTIVEGKAYSAAAFIVAMGTNGYRLATPNSVIMLHEVSLHGEGGYISKQGSQLMACQKQMDGLIETVGKAIGRKSKKTITEFKEELKKDIWLNTTEALKFKIIDGVYGEEGEECTTS